MIYNRQRRWTEERHEVANISLARQAEGEIKVLDDLTQSALNQTSLVNL